MPENSTRAERGRFGERIARRYCRRKLKYKIIARNWRYKSYEVDLICLDNEVLVFIEVRARSESSLVSGYYSVDKRKKAGLELACKAFLRRMSYSAEYFRFDIIEVQLLRSGFGQPRHYKNIKLFHKHFQPNSRI